MKIISNIQGLEFYHQENSVEENTRRSGREPVTEKAKFHRDISRYMEQAKNYSYRLLQNRNISNEEVLVSRRAALELAKEFAEKMAELVDAN